MFPISLDLKGKTALMVGAGRVGRRKLTKIMKAGARVRLVEPHPAAEIITLAEEGRVELFAQFSPELMDGVSLVFAATDSAEYNRRLAEEARRRQLWVNVADSPELSDFTLPALVSHGLFQLTASTGGGSPALAAAVAEELRSAYGPEYGRLAALLAGLRPAILSAGLDNGARETLFKRLANSPQLRGALAAGRDQSASEILAELIKPLELPENFKIPSE